MKRNTLNFAIDGISALVVFGLIATGLVIRFTLPPGSGSLRALWGLGRHDWGDLHFWLAVAGAALLIVHVALHWQWVCVTLQRLIRGGASASPPAAMARNLYGAAFILFLVAVFGGFLWIANSSVRYSPTGEPARHGNASPEDLDHADGPGPDSLRGSMKLADVAAATGVPVETLKTGLGIPQNTSADERLSSLMRQYNFRMSQVRRVIEQSKRPQ